MRREDELPEQRERNRKRDRARSAALNLLRTRHRDEFWELYQQELKRRGIQ